VLRQRPSPTPPFLFSSPPRDLTWAPSSYSCFPQVLMIAILIWTKQLSYLSPFFRLLHLPFRFLFFSPFICLEVHSDSPGCYLVCTSKIVVTPAPSSFFFLSRAPAALVSRGSFPPLATIRAKAVRADPFFSPVSIMASDYLSLPPPFFFSLSGPLLALCPLLLSV